MGASLIICSLNIFLDFQYFSFFNKIENQPSDLSIKCVTKVWHKPKIFISSSWFPLKYLFPYVFGICQNESPLTLGLNSRLDKEDTKKNQLERERKFLYVCLHSAMVEICWNSVQEIHQILNKMYKHGLAAIHPEQNQRIKCQGVLQTSWTTMDKNLKHFYPSV